jgi:hypothetical protein
VEHQLVNGFTALVRLASLIACLIVVMAFLMFATNQAGTATNHLVNDSGLPASATPTAAKAPAKPSSVRQTVTDASNTLTSPFQNVLGSSNTWVLHTSQLVLALLIYGFGVSFVTRWLRLRHE